MANVNLTRTGVFAQKKSTCVSAMRLKQEDIATSADVYQLAVLPPRILITAAYIANIEASDAATSAVADLGFDGDDALISAADLKTADGIAESSAAPVYVASGGVLTFKPTYTGAVTAGVGDFNVVVEYAELDKTSGEYTKFLSE